MERFADPSTHTTLKHDGELAGELDLWLQDRLRQHFAAQGLLVLGEEDAQTPTAAALRTGDAILVDPVDGTHNFLLGLPLFGCMCTFLRAGQVWASLIWLPAEHRLGSGGTYIACDGLGAWLQRTPTSARRLTVSRTSELREAFVSVEGKTHRIANSLPARQLIQQSRRARTGLSSCWAGTRLARGSHSPASLDAVLCIENKPWDNLPLAFMVEQAEGRVTDLQGRPWTLDNCSSLLMTNGHLHAQALAALASGTP